MYDNVCIMPACVKHIDIRHHACKEQVQLGTIAYTLCPSLISIAHWWTKVVPRTALDSQKGGHGFAAYHATYSHMV